MTRCIAVVWVILTLLGCANSERKEDRIKVTIAGVVRKPGEYSLPTGFNLKQALVRAGGIEQFAVHHRIQIVHRDGSIEICKFKECDGALVLSDGDVIVVEDGTL